MSVGHRHQALDLHRRQLDDLLAQPWFTRCLARAERDIQVVTDCDMPYVAGSDSELEYVFIDRHAYPVIVKAGLLPSLLKHEIVEGILERRGWMYLKEPLASHLVASAAEDRENAARGISKAQADAIYAPLIKADAVEKLKYVPITLNMKPLLETGSRKLLAHMGLVMAGGAGDDDSSLTLAGGGSSEGKLRKDEVDYAPRRGALDGPAKSGARCELCRYFEVRGPRQCLKVQGDISPWAWCRLFER